MGNIQAINYMLQRKRSEEGTGVPYILVHPEYMKTKPRKELFNTVPININCNAEVTFGGQDQSPPF